MLSLRNEFDAFCAVLSRKRTPTVFRVSSPIPIHQFHPIHQSFVHSCYSFFWTTKQPLCHPTRQDTHLNKVLLNRHESPFVDIRTPQISSPYFSSSSFHLTSLHGELQASIDIRPATLQILQLLPRIPTPTTTTLQSPSPSPASTIPHIVTPTRQPHVTQ